MKRVASIVTRRYKMRSRRHIRTWFWLSFWLSPLEASKWISMVQVSHAQTVGLTRLSLSSFGVAPITWSVSRIWQHLAVSTPQLPQIWLGLIQIWLGSADFLLLIVFIWVTTSYAGICYASWGPTVWPFLRRSARALTIKAVRGPAAFKVLFDN